MTNLATINQGSLQFNREQLDLIQRTIAVGSTPDELALFVNQCKRTGLDPFTRQIYFMKSKTNGKITIMTSVDGLRLIAERSDKYEGQTEPLWCGEDGVWKDVWLSKKVPAACKVGVYKKGFREALYAVAIFDEYAQRHAKTDSYNNPPRFKAGDLTEMWVGKPSLMIAKVAESLALRKAFPNDISGLYSQEEMGQSQPQPVELKSSVAVPAAKQPAKQVAAQVSPQPQQSDPLAGEPVDASYTEVTKESTEYERFETPHEGRVVSSDATFMCGFGQFKGVMIQDIESNELSNYLSFLETSSKQKNKPITGKVLDFYEAADRYLKNFQAK